MEGKRRRKTQDEAIGKLQRRKLTEVLFLGIV